MGFCGILAHVTGNRTDLTDIASRNLLRKEASLPLLDVSSEMARLKRVREETDFDRYAEREANRFKHLMAERQGWIAKMGAWSLIRRKLRDEWQQHRKPRD